MTFVIAVLIVAALTLAALTLLEVGESRIKRRTLPFPDSTDSVRKHDEYLSAVRRAVGVDDADKD